MILKDYVDDLVFALYFNIELNNIGFENKEEIKLNCKKSKFYDMIQEFN